MSTEQSTKTLAKWIEERGITALANRAESNPNADPDTWWPKGARHWLVRLSMGSRTLDIPFSQGSAHSEAPTAADVLDCLASDASCVMEGQSFAEFCADMGYDQDSRKAERTYRIVKAQTDRLRKFLGAHGDALASLVYDVERL